jgi:hypothetical protein
VQQENITIKVKYGIDHYFPTMKGLRYGDPMSPIIFSMVADMLGTITVMAKWDGKEGALIPHLVDSGVSILQYMDAITFFVEHTLE